MRKKLGDIRYSYREKRKGGEPVRIYKRVYFYLLRYIRGDVRDHDHEVDEARWFPIAEALIRSQVRHGAKDGAESAGRAYRC